MSATNCPACRVWLVRELIDRAEVPKREQAQDAFVLANNAAEACLIVGEDERRRIISIQEVCPISQLPDNRYEVVLRGPKEERSTQTNFRE